MGDPQVTMGLNTAYIIMVHIILDDKCLQNRKTQFFLKLIIYTIYILYTFIWFAIYFLKQMINSTNTSWHLLSLRLMQKGI